MKNSLFILLVTALLLPVETRAQEEPARDNDLISLLTHKKILTQTESDSLKKNKSTAFKPTGEIHAMGHLSFRWEDRANPTNTFQLERAFIFGSARLTPKIDFFGLYYFAPSAVNHIHELWGRYKFNPAFNIKVGFMKVPYTFENLVPTTLLHTIDFAQSTEALAGVTTDVIGVNVGRDAGIEISGEFINKESHNLLFYNAGVYNGSGSRTLKDLNNAKDIALMFGVQPIKGWRFQTSTILGCATYERLSEGIAIGDHTRNRFSIGTQYDRGKFYGRAEYLYGRDATIDRNGFYFLGLYRPLSFLDILAAYDWYNKDIGNDKTISVRYNVGFTIWINSLCRLQTFYTINDKPNAHETSNRFMTQLQIGF